MNTPKRLYSDPKLDKIFDDLRPSFAAIHASYGNPKNVVQRLSISRQPSLQQLRQYLDNCHRLIQVCTAQIHIVQEMYEQLLESPLYVPSEPPIVKNHQEYNR